MARDLTGESVVVIGGSSGIGLATAAQALKAGATVTIAARDSDRLESARRDLAGPDGDVQAAVVDITDEESVARLFESVGDLHHLVVLPGAAGAGRIVDTETSRLRTVVDVRLWGALHACKHAAPTMHPGGSITLCSGAAAHRPQPNRSIGAAATAAVEAFGRALALELAPVRVNVICPGPTETPLLDRSYGDERDARVAELAEVLPVGHIAAPGDIADAVMFLMGNASVTGTTLVVDGGFLLIR